MANTKISELTSLGASPAGADIVPLTDVSGPPTTKSVTVTNLMGAAPVQSVAGRTGAVTIANTDVSGLGTASTSASTDFSPAFFSTVADTSTARTLSDSDNGKVILCTNTNLVTVSVPTGLTAGFNCILVQGGAGVVNVSGSATINSRGSKTATAGQYASLSIIPTGTDSYILEGDTAVDPTFGFPTTSTTNLKLAYSLRKVVSGYSGYAIRVRRSSDNSEQDIGFSGDDLDSSALTTFVGAGNDGFIEKWYNQTGDGNDAFNTTVATQPTIVTSGSVLTSGGKPSIYFNQKVLQITTMTFNRSYDGDETLMAVFNTSSSNNQHIIGTGSTGSGSTGASYFNGYGDKFGLISGEMFRLTSSSAFGGSSNQFKLTDATVALNNTNLGLYTRASHANTLSVDSGAGSTATSTSAVAWNTGYTTASIGASGNQYNSAPFTGYISEILQWHESLASDSTAIKADVANYYTL